MKMPQLEYADVGAHTWTVADMSKIDRDWHESGFMPTPAAIHAFTYFLDGKEVLSRCGQQRFRVIRS